MKKNLSHRILKRVSLADVLRVVFPNKFISKRGKARCPLHEDKHPSFAYRTVDGIDRWKCFAGCGQGDALSFLIKTGTCKTPRECITWLFNNDILDKDLLSNEDDKNYLINSLEKYRLRQELLEKFSNFTKDCILSSTEAAQTCRDYFKERGIDNVETLTGRFNVGFFDSSRMEHYGFKKKEMQSLGILGSDKKILMDKSISFMYQKTFGEFSGFKLRPLDSKKAKFFSAGGKKDDDIGFFGLNSYEGKDLYDIRNNDIILVEGEFDVLVPQYKAIHMFGDVFGIVCRSGGAATSPASFNNLRQHGITNICVFPDNDAGGREFIEKCSRSASSNNVTIDVMWPPEYDILPGTDRLLTWL
jgi:DNA primase